MPRNKSARKYQLTINNPLDHGFTHGSIRESLSGFSGLTYWCLCDEVGEQGTPHTHVYAAFKNPVEFAAVQRRFYGAHIEAAKGSHRENRDYVRKEGKWRGSEKAETNLPDTFEESGPLPEESSARVKQSEAILDMVQDGASNAQIILAFPSAMNHLPRIDQARQTLRAEEFANTYRDVDVTYLWGPTGTGKTRGILEHYGYASVYRVTNYAHPFDGYQGQAVILFDEFRSSLPLSDMLVYLDGYPVMLPARFSDKAACYTAAYLVSNIPLEDQYPHVQLNEPESYKALLRRIRRVWQLTDAMDGQLPFEGV